MTTAIRWIKAKCLCGREYEYPEGGYKPSTCSSFDCVQKYLHPELNKDGKDNTGI